MFNGTRVFEAATTTNATSLVHLHNTNGGYVLIQINGTMGGCTVTPWVSIDEALERVALEGINYTTATVYKLRLTRNATIDLRITNASGTTSIKASILSVEGT